MPACCSTSPAAPISSARTRRASARCWPTWSSASRATTSPAAPPWPTPRAPPGRWRALPRRQADLFCPPRGQRDALAALPVEGLRLDAPILETFLKLGLRRIGDLYPLPRAPLARRFGDQPLTRLDQALGTLAEPIEPRRPPPAFRTRLAFVEPIGRPEDIAAATSRLLAALCRQFEQAGVGARKLEIALYRVDGSVDRTVDRHQPAQPRQSQADEAVRGEARRARSRLRRRADDPGRARGRGLERHAGCAARVGRDRRLAGRGRHDRSRRPAGAAAGRGERGAPAAARQPSARARADDGRRLGQARCRPAPGSAWPA